jgi:hypothetical protein
MDGWYLYEKRLELLEPAVDEQFSAARYFDVCKPGLQ